MPKIGPYMPISLCCLKGYTDKDKYKYLVPELYNCDKHLQFKYRVKYYANPNDQKLIMICVNSTSGQTN